MAKVNIQEEYLEIKQVNLNIKRKLSLLMNKRRQVRQIELKEFKNLNNLKMKSLLINKKILKKIKIIQL